MFILELVKWQAFSEMSPLSKVSLEWTLYCISTLLERYWTLEVGYVLLVWFPTTGFHMPRLLERLYHDFPIKDGPTKKDGVWVQSHVYGHTSTSSHVVISVHLPSSKNYQRWQATSLKRIFPQMSTNDKSSTTISYSWRSVRIQWSLFIVCEVVACLPNNPFYETRISLSEEPPVHHMAFCLAFGLFRWLSMESEERQRCSGATTQKTQTCCLTSMGAKWKSIQEMVILRILKSGRFIKRFCPEVDSVHHNDPRKKLDCHLARGKDSVKIQICETI